MFTPRRIALCIAAVAATAASAMSAAGELSTRFAAALKTTEACDCDVSGKAYYRDDAGKRRFQIEVKGFPAGTELVLEVGGENVGTVVVRNTATGAVGKLSFSDKLEDGVSDNPRTLFPANFPDVLAGASVVAGPLSGSFALKEISGGEGTGGGGSTPGEIASGDLECRVDLAAEDASLDADFRYENGRMRFGVSVEAAPGGSYAAGDRMNVSVDGVQVATITLDALLGGDVGTEFDFDTGAGAGDVALPFPVDFPGVAIGSVVAVEPAVVGAPTMTCALQPD
jgi:hypothetical protein